jgi:hypothetical protein
MEVVVDFFKSIFFKCLNWILSLVWTEGQVMLTNFLFKPDQDIIVSEQEIEFRFTENVNRVSIKYRLESRTPYAFELNGIHAIVKVYNTEITKINHLTLASMKSKGNLNIQMEYNLNEFETNKVKSLKSGNNGLLCEIIASHFITFKKENKSFDKTIRDTKAVLVMNQSMQSKSKSK